MKLRIGISPCPNDTFIFDSLYTGKLNTEPFKFEFIFEDVQTLNKLALNGELDIIKLSYAHYFNVLDSYVMLRSGGALGNGVGPLLIASHQYNSAEINQLNIAIPGIYTTANFLLMYAFPAIKTKKEYVFSSIEKAVLKHEVDAGVIIHENRFTYQDKGLIKLMDLGEYWEQQTSLPIPLGGIAIKRTFDKNIQLQINNLIQSSILLSKADYPLLSTFVTSHAQEMSEDVMRQHIELYVNPFSLDISPLGEEAVQKMADILSIQNSINLFI